MDNWLVYEVALAMQRDRVARADREGWLREQLPRRYTPREALAAALVALALRLAPSLGGPVAGVHPAVRPL